MPNLMQLAQNLVQLKLQQNPNIPNTPWAQQGINAIMNGDASTGEALANNILKSYGLTKEQALSMAPQLLNNLHL